jgi:hypothetical protein
MVKLLQKTKSLSKSKSSNNFKKSLTKSWQDGTIIELTTMISDSKETMKIVEH